MRHWAMCCALTIALGWTLACSGEASDDKGADQAQPGDHLSGGEPTNKAKSGQGRNRSGARGGHSARGGGKAQRGKAQRGAHDRGRRAEPAPAPQPKAPANEEPAQECCVHCSTGKPCGDSCISQDQECHQPPGCAC